jgi:hypothetical protein
MTMDSLKISNIHTFLIEEIRRKVAEMGKIDWKIQFCWFKAQARIQEMSWPTDWQRRQQ